MRAVTHHDQPRSRSQGRTRRQGGAALLVAVLMMALMATIGFASLDTVARGREVAGNTSRSFSALYAADAGIAASLQTLRTSATTTALTPGDCLDANVPAATLANGSTYQADTTATNQICMLASADPCLDDTSLELNFFYTVWDMRVQGEAPGGTISRVQATAGRCHSFD